MALRLRYQIDTPGSLREHLHLVEDAGYFFFPGITAGEGDPVALLVSFTEGGAGMRLLGTVWARPASGGAWLEIPGAARALDRAEASFRDETRAPTQQLALALPAARPALLCRLIDVSEGGARLSAEAADVGMVGERLRIALPEAGPTGAQLEAFGRVAWAAAGEVGVEWLHGDLASRAAVRRMLQVATEEWEGAPLREHPEQCRCRKAATAHVLLLG